MKTERERNEQKERKNVNKDEQKKTNYRVKRAENFISTEYGAVAFSGILYLFCLVYRWRHTMTPELGRQTEIKLIKSLICFQQINNLPCDSCIFR